VLTAREGKALNKRGQRYKPRAIDDIEEVIRVHVEPALGTRRITGIRRGDAQAIVDELSPRLSGSRVRSVSDLRVRLTREPPGGSRSFGAGARLTLPAMRRLWCVAGRLRCGQSPTTKRRMRAWIAVRSRSAS
jgi:hypothetical protein